MKTNSENWLHQSQTQHQSSFTIVRIG
jgi:hypothetical protein